MTQDIQIIRLRAKTLLKIYFFGALFTIAPIAILAGIPAAFGADTMKVGDIQVHGLKALFHSIVDPPCIAAIFALLFVCLTWPGLWLLSKFRKITISIYTNDA